MSGVTASAQTPANNNFANAQVISGSSGSVTGSNVGATKEAGEPNHAGNSGGRSVWYRWTAPATGSATFNTQGSNYDTTLAVYIGGSVNALTLVAANDDLIGLQSSVTFEASAGVVYRIAVDGYNGASGSITLNWSLTVANDNFANAQVISGSSGSVTGSNVGATKEAGEPNHAGQSGGASVWYSWTAPESRRVVFTTAGSGFNTLLAVYVGHSLATLQQVAGNDDDPERCFFIGPISRVGFDAVAGTNYRIAVDGNFGSTGNVALLWGGAASISGKVTDFDEKFAIAFVNVTLDGGGICRLVPNGNGEGPSPRPYVFTDVPVGINYTVSPRLQMGFGDFCPRGTPSGSLSPLRGDVSGLSFYQCSPAYTITGRVRDSAGNGISGIQVTVTGSQSRTVTTNSSGDYNTGGLVIYGDYTVSPSSGSLNFTPSNRSFSRLLFNVAGADFTGNPNTPPTVSLTSPAANSSFTAPATINLAAAASDADGTIQRVEFFEGQTLLSADTSAPYEYSWTGVPAGSYILTARAFDNAGAATTSAAVAVTVAAPNQPPQVSLTSPAPGTSFTAPATINLAASASDADGTVAKVEFYSGATKLGEDTSAPYEYTWQNVPAGTYSLTAKAFDNAGASSDSPPVQVTVSPGTQVLGLQYYPLPRPVRLLDTRPGEPACANPAAPLSAGASLVMHVTGTCAGVTIPASAKAVVGNATVVSPSAAGFATLYPTGAQRPTVSNLNYVAGQVVPNSFTTSLSEAGQLSIYSSQPTHVVVDVTGYYAPPGAGGLYYHPLPRPVRLLDTRINEPACFAPGSPVQGGAALAQTARATCDGVVLPDGALALVGNATVVNPPSGGEGFVTLYPSGAARPTASNLNYVPGQVVPNSFTVGLGADGAFQIYAHTTLDFVVDVTGYYSASAAPDANAAGGLLYYALTSPVRLLDTRPGEPACDAPGAALQGGAARAEAARVACAGQTIPAAAQVVVGNATVVNDGFSGGGFVTLYPSGAQRPTASNLNYVAGQVVPNSFVVGLGDDGAFRIYPLTSLHFVVDLSGYFAP